MKKQETANQARSEAREKPGFFKRMVAKLDEAMKQKATDRSQKESCCEPGAEKGKGGKCC